MIRIRTYIDKMAPGSLPVRMGPVWPYFVATLIIVLCYFIKLATPHSILHEIPFLIFFSGVVICGVYGGFGVGVYATILSAIFADYYFLTPTHTLIKQNWHQDFKLFLYIVDCVTIAGLCGSLKKALERAKRLEAANAESESHRRRSEEKLQSALESAEMGSWYMDLQTMTLTTSDGVAKILGAPPTSGEGFEWILHTLHPQDRESVKAAWKASVNTHVKLKLDFRIVRKDGTQRWVSARGDTKFEAGLPLYFTGVISDITDAKESAVALARERHKLETIFTDAPAAMAIWSGRDLVFENVNPRYQAIFPNRQLKGVPLEVAVPELREQSFKRLLLEVLDTGVPYVGTEEPALIPDENGTLVERYYDFSYIRISDPNGLPYGVYDHAVDVTDRVLARRKTEESQERLRLALQGAQMGTWTIRWPGDEVIHDEKFGALHGTFPNEKVDEIIQRRIHPEDGERLRRALEFAIRNRTPYAAEYRIMGLDGEYRWIFARGEPKYDSAGTPISMSGVAFDIHERVQTQRDLEAAKVDAERANEAKSAFLANMSHEIRTPLGAVLGFVSLLKDHSLPRDEADRYLDIIDRNSSHLLRIIDDVLDLAKVEAGKIVIEKVQFSLPELLDDFASLMRVRAVEGGIGFELKTDGALPEHVVSDPTRIRQILNNIVGNAIKFTSQGHVTLTVRAEDRRIFFRVADTGRGISEEQRLLLFQAFAQADTSTTRKFGGTGLGLVLTRRLSEALGGGFDLVMSELDKGSTFESSVLVEVAERGRTESGTSERKNVPRFKSTSEQTAELSGLDVLLVEDSPDNQVLIQMLIMRAGANITVASNGQEGVEKALAHSYDVVLMDIQMPVMDGHQAVRLLRSKGYRGTVIALTAHVMSEERRRSEQSGFDEFLSKPIDRDALFTALHHYRDRRKFD